MNHIQVAEIITEEAAKEFPGMSNPSKLSNEDVNRIAEAVVEKAAEDVGVRDIMIGSAMGKGAIPLYGRETRKEPCACCLIDFDGPNSPENRMCTTKGAIGILSDREEREWCSEIKIVSDGRCARARSIREAARECKEMYPEDTEAFFRCYIPAFSQATKESNPDTGTCYEEAWRFLIKQEEGELIHGSVQTIGKRINHAWVELPTGYVWEPESGEFMKKSYFYERAEPIEEHRYTVEEAAIMLVRVGKHGPWTDEERARWLHR
jgi:hypothetical protein